MKRDLKRHKEETLAQWIDRLTPIIMRMEYRYEVQQTLIGIKDEAYWQGQFDATEITYTEKPSTTL